MQADTRTLKDILVGERRFVIPPYQRPYVWERDRQWEPLWDDLADTIARLAESRADAHAKGKHAALGDEHTAPHFLGAIVLDQLPTAAGEIDRRHVVDGQQRLTTTQLLLRGILDALEQREVSAKLCSQLRKLMRNDDDVITEPDTAFKVWPRRAEREAFRATMATEPPDPEGSRFAAARSFFCQAAGEWLDNNASPTDPFVEDVAAGRAGLLVAAVRDLLKVVVIDLEGVDDAQVIFEVLNARHTPLTAADLLKNLLFLRAENEGLKVEELYDQHWQHFDDPWWSEQVGVGHATRARQDFLLGDWLTARSAHAVNVGHLYGFAKTWISRSGEKVPDVLSSIGSYAAAFRLLAGANDDGVTARERQAFRHIAVLRVTAANPLLLWLLTRRSDELTRHDRERAILAVESYLVRRMAAKEQTRAYVTVFIEVLRAAQQAGEHSADAVIAALHRGPHGYSWPSDSDLVASFADARAYGPGGINQARLKLILGAVDRRLHELDHKGEDVTIDYANLTVEHVMPQAWRAHWPLTVGDGEGGLSAAVHRDRHVHRIGNLTLLTAALNPAVSHGPWSAKRGAIADHSVLRLNHRICAHAHWDEAAILERGRWLAGEVAAIWPAPPAAVPLAPVTAEPVANINNNVQLLLSVDDLDFLHRRLWETATDSADARGWRLYSASTESLLEELGAAGDVELEEAVRREALERLVGNGKVERLPEANAGGSPSMWVRPPK